MTKEEYIKAQKRFDQLFSMWEQGHKFSVEENREYIRLVNILAEHDRQQNFSAVIRSGDYRTA